MPPAFAAAATERLRRACHRAPVLVIPTMGSVLYGPPLLSESKLNLAGGGLVYCVRCARVCELANAVWERDGPNCSFCQWPTAKGNLLRATYAPACSIPACNSTIVPPPALRRDVASRPRATQTATYIDDMDGTYALVRNGSLCIHCSAVLRAAGLCRDETGASAPIILPYLLLSRLGEIVRRAVKAMPTKRNSLAQVHAATTAKVQPLNASSHRACILAYSKEGLAPLAIRAPATAAVAAEAAAGKRRRKATGPKRK